MLGYYAHACLLDAMYECFIWFRFHDYHHLSDDAVSQQTGVGVRVCGQFILAGHGRSVLWWQKCLSVGHTSPPTKGDDRLVSLSRTWLFRIALCTAQRTAHLGRQERRYWCVDYTQGLRQGDTVSEANIYIMAKRLFRDLDFTIKLTIKWCT